MMREASNRIVARRDWLRWSLGTILGGVSGGLASCQSAQRSRRTYQVGSKKKDWHSEEFRKMVTLGESTTAGGWSTSPERCWVPVLAALINDFQTQPIEYVNSGIGANVISRRSPSYEHSGKPAALERLDKHVIVHKPDLLIVSYGLNDARGATPLDLFREEMERLLSEVRREIQPLIVLLSPYYMSDFDRYGPHWNHATLEIFAEFGRATAEIATANECLYADVLSAAAGADWVVHHDTVHQNDVGHRLVAHRIFEVLAQNCSGIAKKTRAAEKISPRWRDESVLRADYGY